MVHNSLRFFREFKTVYFGIIWWLDMACNDNNGTKMKFIIKRKNLKKLLKIEKKFLRKNRISAVIHFGSIIYI